MYRLQARDHERSLEALGGTKMLVPGMEQAYQETADYADKVAWELEKDPDGTVEIEQDLIYLMDVVRFREAAVERLVERPFFDRLQAKQARKDAE